MALADLRTFLDQPVLTLPVDGKKYTVQPCKADVWLRLQEIARRAEQPDAETVEDVELFKLALGDLYGTLLPLVTGPELTRIGTTAYLWQLGHNDLAAEFWRSGGKAPEPSTGKPSRKKTPTAAATTTRRRASGSGTTTRRNSNANKTG